VQYAYRCQAGHEITSGHALDQIECPEHGMVAKRIRRFAIGTAQARKDEGHWNPVVGQYVKNDAEFRSVLAQQVERESEALNCDVKLALVDSRDKEGIAELHGIEPDHYAETAEDTKRHKHDQGVPV
jgi:hypothetical protein